MQEWLIYCMGARFPKKYYNMYKAHKCTECVEYFMMPFNTFTKMQMSCVKTPHVHHIHNVFFTLEHWGRSKQHNGQRLLWSSGPSRFKTGTICLFRKVEIYRHVIDLFPPVLTTGSTKAVHVFSCLCYNACKRFLAICRKSRVLCPVNRLLAVPIWPACAEQGR